MCIVIVKSNDRVPFEVKVRAKDVLKYFETGESVRIIAGTHSGDSGIIAAINDKHAVVSMDAEKGSELKILLSNLKSKKEEMEHVKLKDYIQKSIVEIKYQAGDLILYENH
jgi:transcription elongation factor